MKCKSSSVSVDETALQWTGELLKKQLPYLQVWWKITSQDFIVLWPFLVSIRKMLCAHHFIFFWFFHSWHPNDHLVLTLRIIYLENQIIDWPHSTNYTFSNLFLCITLLFTGQWKLIKVLILLQWLNRPASSCFLRRWKKKKKKKSNNV